MLKKHLSNPIVRNVVVIIAIVAALLALGLVASVIKTVIGWVLGFGWKILLAIAVTALLCGVIFGFAEMRIHGKTEDDDYED